MSTLPTIEIDRELCMGSASCTIQAPNTFDVDDEMKAVLMAGPFDSTVRIRAAIDGCPTRALRMIDSALS
jgi:ferredoxin